MKVEDIKKIAMIGAGDMGRGIAEVVAMSGYKVNLYDIKQEFVDGGISQIIGATGRRVAARDHLSSSMDRQVAERRVAQNQMIQEAMDKIVGGIMGFTLKDAVKDVDYRNRGRPEILDLEKKNIKEMDEAAPKSTQSWPPTPRT